jgi:hypothetical protein
VGQVNDRTIKKIELLLEAVERRYPSYWVLIGQSLVRGLFAGLGATIGVSIVLALATYLIGYLELLPWLSPLIERVPVEEILPGGSGL